MKCEFYFLEKMYSVDVDDIQAKEMAKFCNEATNLYEDHRKEYYDESDPNHKAIREAIRDCHEKMIRVVIPDYNLPEKYEWPSITHSKPNDYYDIYCGGRRPRYFSPPSQQQYLPTNKGWGFFMSINGKHFCHKSGNMKD